MLKSIGAFHAVRLTEVVRISEGPLREVPLYRHVGTILMAVIESLLTLIHEVSHMILLLLLQLLYLQGTLTLAHRFSKDDSTVQFLELKVVFKLATSILVF